MSDTSPGIVSMFPLFSYTFWVRSMFFNIFLCSPAGAGMLRPSPEAAKAFTSCGLVLSRTLSGFWTGDMKNPFPGMAGEKRRRAAHRADYQLITSPAMLSSEFWRNFLPAGKDFTIPAPNFLPAGIPFLE